MSSSSSRWARALRVPLLIGLGCALAPVEEGSVGVPQVWREHAEASAQPCRLRFPQGPVERMTVDQDDALAAATIVIRKLHRESVNRHCPGAPGLLPRYRYVETQQLALCPPAGLRGPGLLCDFIQGHDGAWRVDSADARDEHGGAPAVGVGLCGLAQARPPPRADGRPRFPGKGFT